MSGSSDKATRLRALADSLDGIAELESDLANAKAAYAADRDDPDAKAEHRRASQALSDARSEIRSAGVAAVSTEPGSTTVILGAPVGASGSEG